MSWCIILVTIQSNSQKRFCEAFLLLMYEYQLLILYGKEKRNTTRNFDDNKTEWGSKKMHFVPKKTDFNLSPYTGLTRESWLEAGVYLLEGLFQHISDISKPVVMPRKETKITYPHLHDSEQWQATQRLAEIFEGLTRSFLIAAPVIENMPDVTCNGILLREYYKQHLLRVCTKGDPLYVGDYEEQLKIVQSDDQYRTFQQTVETCAMVIGLDVCEKEIWSTYTQEEKDRIAAFLSSYAHHSTVPQNWRMFNMLDMAFLKKHGYEIDEDIMKEHTQAILAYYAGNGWYRDGHSFDYYSSWAFQVYGPIWCKWYGYEHMPYAAEQFEKHSNELMKTYPDFFDADGYTNMWGRSNIYRNAATTPLEGNFQCKNPVMDPGRARRIASGSLLQFLGRDDFLYRGVPTLGFYGQFSPLVQGYSCAESPLWLGKAFLCLHLPADHPFWTAKENNGTWETLGEKEVKVTTLNGPALCFSNHKANKSTILRTGKVVKAPKDMHGMWNYSKLAFHTKYPWEANDAQQYVLTDIPNGTKSYGNVTFWAGEKEGVLYRRQFFDYDLDRESHWIQGVNLADFTVPYGIVRVDKMRVFRAPVTFTLGSFGFPDNGTKIIQKEQNGQKAIILKGKDSLGKEKQMAMTIMGGFDELEVQSFEGTNPDSEKSMVIFAKATRRKHLSYEPYLMISQVLTKEGHEDFSLEELFPIMAVHTTDPENAGGYGPVVLEMKDGSRKVIDYDEMEGRMMV